MVSTAKEPVAARHSPRRKTPYIIIEAYLHQDVNNGTERKKEKLFYWTIIWVPMILRTSYLLYRSNRLARECICMQHTAAGPFCWCKSRANISSYAHGLPSFTYSLSGPSRISRSTLRKTGNGVALRQHPTIHSNWSHYLLNTCPQEVVG